MIFPIYFKPFFYSFKWNQFVSELLNEFILQIKVLLGIGKNYRKVKLKICNDWGRFNGSKMSKILKNCPKNTWLHILISKSNHSSKNKPTYDAKYWQRPILSSRYGRNEIGQEFIALSDKSLEKTAFFGN